MPGIQVDTHIDMIRQSMIKTAHHEAGHAAINAFFGENHTHFEEITIIPGQCFVGTFTQSRVFDLIISRQHGWIKIAGLLAGRLAGKRFDDDFWAITEILENGWESDTLVETESEWRKTVDEGKALTIAEEISTRGWPALRILEMVEGWTENLLENIHVWNVVETLAKRLLDAGSITDFEEYEAIVKPILYKWPEHPAWKRRLRIKVYPSVEKQDTE